MQTQPLTWQAFLLQLLLSLGPAAVALAATYITLRHQRKLKRDELSISSTLRARELMFGLYEKRLSILLERSALLGETVAKVQVALRTTEDTDKQTEAISAFFSVIYAQAVQMPEFIEEVENELPALGLADKYAGNVSFIKTNLQASFQSIPPGDPDAVMDNILLNMLKAMAFMINIQRDIVEAKAKELFEEYLPPTSNKLARNI